ncbi:hypothetical protein AAFF_G00440080 [Aldrovandia affinis]|uniref:TNFR-Cys domain-containing protein n=1 Tax=Aldrovandia affinis TaxID=143900 RepID=A0AAD7S734_9TELE|nr:hypothetical protein AAFF_G00440080 [Aldrovandia affinis]
MSGQASTPLEQVWGTTGTEVLGLGPLPPWDVQKPGPGGRAGLLGVPPRSLLHWGRCCPVSSGNVWCEGGHTAGERLLSVSCSAQRPGSQFMCPRGYYCEEGTGVPHGTPCPTGTAGGQLAQTSRVACKRCSEGRFCPAGSVEPGLACARGRFCPAGTREEVSCPKGTFTPHQGATSVKDCLKCPAGFYCPEGTNNPLPCQPGTFNPLEGQDDPTDCRACYPGKACTQVCLPPRLIAAQPPASACPPGTLSNRTDLTDRSQCQQCPPRYACLRGTGGVQRPPLACVAGHYCPPGTMFPTQHKCPAGSWSERSGLQFERECRACPRGWYCLPGAGVPSGRCSSGHYCPEGTQYGSQYPCPPGTYSTKMGNEQREDCQFCPEGHYCLEGTSKPTPCPPTMFRRQKGGQQAQDCSTCPAGYSCPHPATVNPRTCGAGSYSDEGSVECAPCLQGHYCSDETTSEEAMLRVMICPPGLLCSQGLDREPQRSATICPIGFYCPGGSINPNPIPCPNGTYSGQPGLREAIECVVCPEGRFCFSEQPRDHPITEPTGRCPDGHHCPLGTGHPLSFPCQAGFFRNSYGHRGALCVPCPAGYYCGSPATHTPTICPKGFFCAEGSRSPEPCEEGTYSSRPALRNGSECTPCGGGRYCSGVGQTMPSGDCQEGFYCRERAMSATPADGPTGGLCPAGSFCPAGSAAPTPCSPGTFSNSTGLAGIQQCVDCPPGNFCSGSNSSSPTGLCFAGHYCTTGSASPTQHQARGQASCLVCEQGRFCNRTGLAHPELCPTGSYCPAGASVPRPCPPGSYLAQTRGEGLQHCGLCDAGSFCRSPGLSAPEGPCEPGFYCSGGASTATPENPCPPGTWSNALGAADPSSCWLCPAGFFCNGTGLTQPSGLCAPGFYCRDGAKSPAPDDGVTGSRCPVGFHCPLGSTLPLNCPDGTYTNTTGTPSPCATEHRTPRRQCSVMVRRLCPGAARCLDCPLGRYCLEAGGVQLCPWGHYCPGGTGEDVLPCPPGTYNPQPGQGHLEQCLLCPAGTYCEDWGLSEPTGPCQPGYFCLAGINFMNPDGNISTGVGGPCPKGHYCPEGTSLPLPCPLGSFSNSLHVKETDGCSPCPPGQFCGSMGLVWPSGPCREGHYCPGGDSSSTGPGTGRGVCPVAHYCPPGSATPLPCPAGSYSNLTGQSLCSSCHAGYYCPGRISNYTRFPCPPGFYCPDGTRHATQYPCPRGYYNPEPMTQSLDSCLPCPPGHYCDKERLTSASGKCKAGWFCVSAAWNSQPFDLDNYTNANCLCPATSTGGRCQEGYYCPVGSPEPHPCPPGPSAMQMVQWCPVGLAQPVGPCSPGYYCIGAATHPKPRDKVTGNICPPGTYCGEGSGEPSPCPAGRFSPVPGISSEAQCQLCTPGSYCAAPGLRAPSGSCSEGYWCPAGQTAGMAEPCPGGHYCPTGSAEPVPCPAGTYQDREKQAACRPCEPGYYCDEHFGAVNGTAPQQCPQGHYCPTGTGVPTQFGCPMGTFNPREGVVSIDGCIVCPPGKFCPAVGLSEPAGDCQAGFWCRGGARSPSPADGVTGVPCPAGQYCPTGTMAPAPCPLGTWWNGTGRRSPEGCQPCPGGFYCDSPGLTAPSGPCSAGFYCTERAVTPAPSDDIAGGRCPAEHYCPIGTTQPVPCEPGTFITVTQATECWPCPPGRYCVDGKTQLCPAGFYCPEGSGYDQRSCPEGTYGTGTGLTAVSQCRECDPGHFCGRRNATDVTGLCQEGYYCSRGNTSPQPLSHSPGEGGPCPAGHYCPRGAAEPQPCPEGTFSNRTRLASKDDCMPCSPGHYCHVAGLSAPSGECWEGFFCQRGAVLPNSPIRDSRGGPCPPGYFCPKGVAAPQVCPEGSVSTVEGEARCSLCPQGLHLRIPTCLSGWDTQPPQEDGPSRGLPALSTRVFLWISGTERCIWAVRRWPLLHCGATSPSPADGNTGDKCPRGHYCLEGSSSPKPCPPGHYSNTSGNTELSHCLPCPAGFSCGSPGLFAPSHLCQAGYYCPLGQTSSSPASHTCSPGHRCPLGSATQSPCAPGTYQDQPGQADCAPCLAGHFCAGSSHPETGHTPSPCPKGHYCPPGTKSGVEFPCPAGTFSDQMGMSAADQCAPCPPGKYCGSAGLAAPTGHCSAGYLCIHGAVVPQPAGDARGGRCSPGAYCPQGSTRTLPCPAGTFNPVEVLCRRWVGLTIRALQPGPLLCNGVQLSGTTDFHKAPHRHFPRQIWCQVRDRVRALPPRVLLPRVGSEVSGTGVSRGLVLPWGLSGRSAVRAPMPTGTRVPTWECRASCVPTWYPSTSTCPAHMQSLCTRVLLPGWCICSHALPRGTVGQTEGLHSQYHCTPCPSGSYCNGSALTTPTGPCTAGHYCALGALEAAPISQAYGDICPQGHYCPQGSSSPTACPMGTYLPDRGARSPALCAPCPPGHYCPSPGASQPSGLCSPGHYCSQGSETATPQASPSDLGCSCDVILKATNSMPSLCSWGQNTSCHFQNTGFYCPEGSAAPRSCDQGLYCDGPGLASPTGPCSPGGSAVEDCLACPSGHYCGQMGLVEPSGPCAAGHYCPEGQTTARPSEYACRAGHFCEEGSPRERACTPGTYQPSGGQRACELCPVGFVCPEEGVIRPTPCQVGFYCPMGTANQLPCPPGSYGNHSGLAEASGCSPCDPGMYCKGSGNISPTGPCSAGFICFGGSPLPSPTDEEVGAQCSPGFYCPAGSSTPRPCPKGTFSEQGGLTGPSQCQRCSPGFYCSEPGLRAVSGPCLPGYFCLEGSQSAAPGSGAFGGACSPGHYCENGTATPPPCPAGTHRPESGGRRIDDCKPCPSGWFQGQEGQTECRPCPPGFHCPPPSQGSGGADAPLPCPAGYFCPHETPGGVPAPCPKGTYSPVQGLSAAEEGSREASSSLLEESDSVELRIPLTVLICRSHTPPT